MMAVLNERVNSLPLCLATTWAPMFVNGLYASQSLQKANVTKLTENISNLRTSDLVVHLDCSLRY